jgi:hypothetical protein
MLVVILWLHTGQFIVIVCDVNLVHGSFFSCLVHCLCSMVSFPVYSIVLLQVLHFSLYVWYGNGYWFVPCCVIFMLVFFGLVVGCWLLVVGCWLLLVVSCWLLVVGC